MDQLNENDQDQKVDDDAISDSNEEDTDIDDLDEDEEIDNVINHPSLSKLINLLLYKQEEDQEEQI